MGKSLAGLTAGVVLGLGALVGLAHAGDGVTPRPAAPSGGADAGLDLSVRARALRIVPESHLALAWIRRLVALTSLGIPGT